MRKTPILALRPMAILLIYLLESQQVAASSVVEKTNGPLSTIIQSSTIMVDNFLLSPFLISHS